MLLERQAPLRFNSGIAASGLGILLIASVLLRSMVMPSNTFLLLSPFLSALGLALLASGFDGLEQYYKELTVILFLGMPQVLVPPLIDITETTAKFAALVLWYSGFEVSRNGLNIYLGSGAVEVYPGCSGIEGIAYLLSLSGLVTVMFPMSWYRRFLTVLAAVTIAFVVNGVRVALMARLIATSDMEVFHYWHEGNGSSIFSAISVLLFAACCWVLNHYEHAAKHDGELVDNSNTPEFQGR